jgi:hypothetical protein
MLVDNPSMNKNGQWNTKFDMIADQKLDCLVKGVVFNKKDEGY